MTTPEKLIAELRKLVILDEVGSDNPLGRDAADVIATLLARATAAEAALEELRGEVERTIAEQLVRHPSDDAWARGRRCGIADVSEALAVSLVSRVKGGDISSRDSDCPTPDGANAGALDPDPGAR